MHIKQIKITPEAILVSVILILCIISAVLIQLDKPALFIIDTHVIYDTDMQIKPVLVYSLAGVVYHVVFDNESNCADYVEYLHKIGRVK